MEHDAEHGRVDSLEFMHEREYLVDERVLHTAVRYNCPNVVEYLIRVGCPVDKTDI